jgi:hypothetical protein
MWGSFFILLEINEFELPINLNFQINDDNLT